LHDVFTLNRAGLLTFGIPKVLVIGRRVGRQLETFAGPRTKIHILAASAAKRPKRIAGRINALTATRWAGNDFGQNSGLIHQRSSTE